MLALGPWVRPKARTTHKTAKEFAPSHQQYYCDRDGTEAAAELLLEPFDSSQVAHLLPPADPSLLLLLPAATASGSGGSPMGDSPGDPRLSERPPPVPPPVPPPPPPPIATTEGIPDGNPGTLSVATVVQLSVERMMENRELVADLLAHAETLNAARNLGNEIIWQGSRVSVIRAASCGGSSPPASGTTLVRMLKNGPQPAQPWASKSLSTLSGRHFGLTAFGADRRG